MFMDFDAIVVGGSFAGLEAATYIARGMRTVCVIDAGLPRNRFAAESHGYLSRDGEPPGAILAAARAQIGGYPAVSMRSGRATAANSIDGGFSVEIDNGDIITAARLVLAFGVSDHLPPVPGLAERWGRTVNHCPYCHGFEFAGKELGVLYGSMHSGHQARLIREWGPTTFFLDGNALDPETTAELTDLGIAIVPDPVAALVGPGTAIEGIQLEGGRTVPIDALYIAPSLTLNSDIAEQLGCALDDGPMGKFIRTDDLRATTVPGVFAAGDITRAFHSVTLAAADGMIAGSSVHRSLVFPS
jgi:thioredoxin reductase